MATFETDEAAFDTCRNRFIRKRGLEDTIGWVVCARYPEGGVRVYDLQLNPHAKRTVVEELSCRACPYPEDRFAFSITVSHDDEGTVAKTTRFEPVLEAPREQ